MENIENLLQQPDVSDDASSSADDGGNDRLTFLKNPNRVVLGNVPNNANASVVNVSKTKKRRSGVDPSLPESSGVCKNTAIIKFCLQFGIPFERTQDPRFKNFLSALDPHHQIPASDAFSEIIASKSLKDLMISLSGGRFSNVMWVQCCKSTSGLVLQASAIITSDRKFIAVDFSRTKEITQDSFIAFCIKSVETVFDYHEVEVAHIIHNMRYDCLNLDSDGDGKIHLLKSFSLLFSNLKRIVGSFDGDDLQSQYKSHLYELHNRMKVDNSIGCASRFIRELLSNDSFNSKSDVVEIINDFLQQIHLTAEFLNSKYQDDYLNEDA
ncbi:hypothetical protein QAD02_013654 [Eretmocerus hayati]|uniref:Uncharacterized protein n=1 Tax=Eretmocerus hayati TaxID=131215 RepID=A0ACC2P3B7_9HYME|nr:hypothetical protein QAD02_013654 [Eretmocerus hayati]